MQKAKNVKEKQGTELKRRRVGEMQRNTEEK